MFDKIASTYILGLDLNPRTLKCAQIIFSRGSVRIDKLATYQVKYESDEKDAALKYDNSAKPPINDQSILVSGVHTSDILVRSLDLKLTKDKDIAAVIPFQAEPLLPYPIENAVLETMQLSKGKGSTQLTLFSVRKDHLQRHLKEYADLDLIPETISSVPAALAAFASFFKNVQSDHPSAVIHIGPTETSCVVCKDSKVLASNAASQIGLNVLIEAYAEDQKITREEAEEALFSQEPLKLKQNSEFSQLYDTLVLQITQSLFGLAKQSKITQIAQIFAVGEGSLLPELHAKLANILNTTITSIETRDHFSSEEIAKYAIPIGLALSELPKSVQKQNFRQGEFAYPDPWKRFKFPLIAYFLSALFLAFALYVLGNTWAGYEEDKAKINYSNALAAMDKPYGAFEKDFHAKFLKSPIDDSEIPSLKSLSQNDLMLRMQFLQEQVKQMPETYPLLPNTPRVSDVLAWLSTHPQVVKKGEGDQKPQTLLNIESFNYSMVKRPDQSKKGEKYQVRVELEFTTAVPKLAREFHDALIAPNDFVDPKGEVKWNSSRDSYRTSFFLKDRTSYPSLSSGG